MSKLLYDTAVYINLLYLHVVQNSTDHTTVCINLLYSHIVQNSTDDPWTKDGLGPALGGGQVRKRLLETSALITRLLKTFALITRKLETAVLIKHLF